jgi:predicted Zn-dependent protease
VGAEGKHQEKFEKGLLLLKENEPHEALDLLQEAAEEEPGNPWFRSYYGLCLGHLKRFAEAEKHCQAAIDLNLAKAQFYINLGEVYLLGARRKRAHEMFSEALKWEKENPLAKKYLAQMGLRKKPVLPFLGRSHPVNVSLGKLRRKLRKPF